jgi:hypothetical protein
LLAISPPMYFLHDVYYLLIVTYTLVKFVPDLLELTLCSSKTIYYSQKILIHLKKIQSIG